MAAAGRRSLLTALVGYLLEPAESAEVGLSREREVVADPVVAVVGAREGCGTTTVARGLGAELALRHPEGACTVTAETVPTAGVVLGTPAAGRLARSLARRVPGRMRAAGRLCLVDADRAPLRDAVCDLAPLVIDVGDPSEASVAASLADAVVIVGTEDVEPALADLIAASLARVGPQPLIALNKAATAHGRWEGRCDLAIPESRIGARLALGGREARGAHGAALAGLAALLEESS